MGIEGELIKRGRNKGFLGWFRGRPWATRHITLECTYTHSALRTWKGDEKRDTIDMIGCTAGECAPNTVQGRKFCVEIKLRWGELFVMQIIPQNDDEAEAEAERKRWIDALNVAGRMPTAVDAYVEKMKIHVLSVQHESCVYNYVTYKLDGSEKFDEINKCVDPDTREGDRDSAYSSGKMLHSKRPAAELIADVEAWIDILNKTFPTLYRSSSEQADIEKFHEDELQRTMATHEHEKTETLGAHGDEGMVASRYDIKVLTDKVNYAKAKEARFYDCVQELVDQSMMRQ